MIRESRENNGSIYRVILANDGDFFLIYMLKNIDSWRPEEDWSADSWERATEICELKWGVPPDSWRELTDYSTIKWLKVEPFLEKESE